MGVWVWMCDHSPPVDEQTPNDREYDTANRRTDHNTNIQRLCRDRPIIRRYNDRQGRIFHRVRIVRIDRLENKVVGLLWIGVGRICIVVDLIGGVGDSGGDLHNVAIVQRLVVLHL